jgi:glycine reductase complex component B subunit gamma
VNKKVRVVHYLNQFFAQIGGEEKADTPPGYAAGPLGPGRAVTRALGASGEVVGTIYCGDNYFAEHEEAALEELLRRLSECKADLLVAGPAFQSGRYGVACGAVCHAAQVRLGMVAVTAMDESNPGAALYRKNFYIVNSGTSVVRTGAALEGMVRVGLKLVRGEPLGKPEAEGYLSRGIKRNEIAARPPAQRAVDMLLVKLRGEPVQSEITPPQFSSAIPAPPLRDLSSALIALVTDGGLVPEGNPEKIAPGRPTRFTSIPIAGVTALGPAEFDVVHSGYDTTAANEDPNRLVPLDVMRELEKEGAIGKLYDVIHATGGAHAAVENATSIGRQIAERLKAGGVQGVILTST